MKKGTSLPHTFRDNWRIVCSLWFQYVMCNSYVIEDRSQEWRLHVGVLNLPYVYFTFHRINWMILHNYKTLTNIYEYAFSSVNPTLFGNVYQI